MDREKVIKELHDARRYLEDKEWSDRCASPHIDAINDVLAILKEQEEGEWIDHTFAHGDDIECPFCHKKWNVIDNCTETFDYCPGCGAKLS